MNNKYLILTILLAILVVSSIGFNIYQYQSSGKLQKELDSSHREIVALNEEKNQREEEIAELHNQVSTLNSQVDSLGNKIKGYLRAEGEITIEGKTCENEVEYCLVKLTERLTGVSGVDCSPVVDNACPLWCAAGSDADCCTKKPGYIWIQGRGCYDVNQI